jgi:hypothetical protein
MDHPPAYAIHYIEPEGITMSLSKPTYLVNTVLRAGDTMQLVPSVIVVEPNTTKEQLDRFEIMIAACMHNGAATDLYDTPAFERVDGVITYPDTNTRKEVSNIHESRLLVHLPVYTDHALNFLDQSVKDEVDAFVALTDGDE